MESLGCGVSIMVFANVSLGIDSMAHTGLEAFDVSYWIDWCSMFVDVVVSVKYNLI